MNISKYTENELHLMSYQELRKISILLQLPANIKKKYMISMIQAHQKGDGWTKIAIAHKIMEERKIKRLSNKAKLDSTLETRSSSTEQVPTDLSVSTKHEFETRFSYVAHYTSKDNLNSGISRIIKQKAEVSRRNRSFLHQTRKTTRKLPSVGRTEIMLPRNHSLTTPVRLMPQYERGFPPPAQYEKATNISNVKTHFQDNTYNYHFRGEYTNSLTPNTTSHEMYREESYWPTRKVYSNSLMPILSSLLTSNSVTFNSSNHTSQFTSQSMIKGSSSFQQGVYEKYVKSEELIENQAYQSAISNSSTVILNNHFNNDDNNNTYNLSHGCRSYIVTKNEVDFELSSARELDCKNYSRREETVVKNENNFQVYNSDFYGPRTATTVISETSQHFQNYPEYSEDCYRMGAKNSTSVQTFYRPFETSPVVLHEPVDVEKGNNERNIIPVVAINNCDSVYVEDKFWEEGNGNKKLYRIKEEKENFGNTQTQGSILSNISENSTEFSVETDVTDPMGSAGSKEDLNNSPVNFTRCRFVQGHNKFPEVVSKTSETMTSLPSFLSAFCANGLYNKGYSVCRNSFTGTTETHLNPIMTCTYASQCNSHSNPQQIINNNPSVSPVLQRQWLYSYPEHQVPFAVESTTYTSWDEYSDDMGNKVVTHNNGHEVQVVKCRKHGCHYLYSVANPCE